MRYMASKPPKKPEKALKEKSIQIRVTKAQKDALSKAATKAGFGLSSWMLRVSLAAAEGGWTLGIQLPPTGAEKKADGGSGG